MQLNKETHEKISEKIAELEKEKFFLYAESIEVGNIKIPKGNDITASIQVNYSPNHYQIFTDRKYIMNVFKNKGQLEYLIHKNI